MGQDEHSDRSGHKEKKKIRYEASGPNVSNNIYLFLCNILTKIILLLHTVKVLKGLWLHLELGFNFEILSLSLQSNYYLISFIKSILYLILSNLLVSKIN